ncbi:MAG: hypothetical protein A2Y18_07050 [Clostridiales bacterium GWD2_32_19]|nr:MAG: hypothetical protein A2Y18_07050 [Clostridiales bacterium GWD2_32_19]
MFKKIILLVAIFVSMMTFITLVFAERIVEVDTTDVDEGIVKVLYENEDVDKAKFMIQKDSKKYYYNLKNTDKTEEFTLQMGDGEYTLVVYENISGTKYRRVYEDTINVQIKDNTSIYTKSVQNIKYDEDSEAVELAKKLTEDADTDEEKAKAIYKYIVKNIEYDRNKIKTIDSSYVPDIDETLEDGTGICYDYSSLYAAMLRSVDVKAKLVKGNSKLIDGYHAWNEVYLDGKWVIVDTTYDAYKEQHDRSYTFKKSASKYTTDKEY